MVVTPHNLNEIRERAIAVDASTSLVIIETALRRGIRVELPFDNFKLLWLGDAPIEIRRTMTHKTSAISVAITSDKSLCYAVAESVGMNMLPWIQTLDYDKALEFYTSQKGNCIIKPAKGQAGRDITTSFQDTDDFLKLFVKLSQTDKVIVQAKAEGRNDIRLLFINNKFRAATSTCSTELVGDGVRKLSELIRDENSRRSKDNQTRYPTMLLKELDLRTASTISGVDADDVLPNGQKVEVSLSNSTKGGVSKDVTRIIDSSFIEEAQKLVNRLNLPIIAVDFISVQISPGVTFKESGAFFLEANSSPGIDLHMYPHEGEGVDIASQYIDYLLNI